MLLFCHIVHTSQVHVLHLLKKHRGSRRPSSWRQATITCSQEEAEAALQGAWACVFGAGKEWKGLSPLCCLFV